MQHEVNIILRALQGYNGILSVVGELNMIVLWVHKRHAQAVDRRTLDGHSIQHLLLFLITESFTLCELLDLGRLIGTNLERCNHLVHVFIQLFHVKDAHLLLITATDAQAPEQLRDGQVDLTIVRDSLRNYRAAQAEHLVNFLDD